MNKELFVVQRCWHSSPRQIQPMDFFRLFERQQDAEEAAFHSAAAWSHHHIGKGSVRTLLLPSYPAHNKNGTSYGFIANGSLFWVRSLVASTDAPNLAATHAHVVVTEGVIGGTGNRNSRRGTEVPSGRVFLGTGDRARSMARQACQQIMAQLPKGCHSQVVTIPIGKPQEYASQSFLRDWPPQVALNATKSDIMQPSYKRESHWIGFEGTEVECPYGAQPTKRRRFFSDSSHWCNPADVAAVSEDEMQTS